MTEDLIVLVPYENARQCRAFSLGPTYFALTSLDDMSSRRTLGGALRKIYFRLLSFLLKEALTMKKALPYIVLAIMSLIGLSFGLYSTFAFDENTPDRWMSWCLTTAAAVLIGSSLTNAVKLWMDHLNHDQNRFSTPEAWARGALLAFENKDEKIEKAKRVYHYYYRSWENGKSFWRYVKLDFRSNRPSGYLYMKYTISKKTLDGASLPETIDSPLAPVLSAESVDSRKSAYEVTIKGFIFNRGLLLLQLGDEREDFSISHFPYFLDTSSVNFGIELHMDWDGSFSCDPNILSEEPLHPARLPGILDEKLGADLEKKWKANQKHAHKVRGFETTTKRR